MNQFAFWALLAITPTEVKRWAHAHLSLRTHSHAQNYQPLSLSSAWHPNTTDDDIQQYLHMPYYPLILRDAVKRSLQRVRSHYLHRQRIAANVQCSFHFDGHGIRIHVILIGGVIVIILIIFGDVQSWWGVYIIWCVHEHQPMRGGFVMAGVVCEGVKVLIQRNNSHEI